MRVTEWYFGQRDRSSTFRLATETLKSPRRRCFLVRGSDGATDQVARYFGFAQQVGLELGPLMPEGLRHTIAFVSTLVTMTLNLDQVNLPSPVSFASCGRCCRCYNGASRRVGTPFPLPYLVIRNTTRLSSSKDATAILAVFEPFARVPAATRQTLNTLGYLPPPLVYDRGTTQSTSMTGAVVLPESGAARGVGGFAPQQQQPAQR